jgi:hypothetical protein
VNWDAMVRVMFELMMIEGVLLVRILDEVLRMWGERSVRVSEGNIVGCEKGRKVI